jgi:DNA polymerase-3 subunit gamma/tau
VIAVGGAEVGDAEVAQILDLIDPQLLLAIGAACVDGDAAAALAACGRAAEAGIDAKRLGASLVKLLRDLVVLRTAPDHPELVEVSDAELAELRALAGRAEPARLRRMFRALVREQEDLAWAPEPFAVLEMAVVRLSTLAPGDDVAELLGRLDALERRLSGGGEGPAAGGAPPPTGSAPRRGPAPSAPPSTPRRAAPETPEPTGAVFDRLRVFAQRENRGLFAALEGGSASHWDGERLVLAIPGGIGARRLLGRRADLDAVCARFFGRSVRVELELPDDGEAGGEEVRGASREEGEARRREALNHPALNAALEILDGEILEIRPLGGSA